MLVISRRRNESVIIGDNIEIIVSEIGSDKVKLCINAPKGVSITRKELLETSNLNKEASIIPRQQVLDSLGKLLK